MSRRGSGGSNGSNEMGWAFNRVVAGVLIRR